MSVITKRGDEGQTDLMFRKRISKTDARLEAYGSIDELNSALGLARAAGLREESEETINSVQEKLIGLMGELATLEEDLPEYDRRGYKRISEDDLDWIEGKAKKIEEEGNIRFRGWSRPGKDITLGGAHLDMARTICRRAERRIAVLREAQQLSNVTSAIFVNRLSDLIWLLARCENSSIKTPEDIQD